MPVCQPQPLFVPHKLSSASALDTSKRKSVPWLMAPPPKSSGGNYTQVRWVQVTVEKGGWRRCSLRSVLGSLEGILAGWEMATTQGSGTAVSFEDHPSGQNYSASRPQAPASHCHPSHRLLWPTPLSSAVFFFFFFSPCFATKFKSSSPFPVQL